MSKTITGVMPIRTVGLTPGHRWCGGLRSVKPAVNNGKGARGLVQGPNSLNASYTHPGRISGRPRKLARDLRNRHVVCGYGMAAGGQRNARAGRRSAAQDDWRALVLAIHLKLDAPGGCAGSWRLSRHGGREGGHLAVDR